MLKTEGNGKYFTDDGSRYDGIWVNDELSDAKKIEFKDGTSYTGHLLNGQFNGQGVYSIPGIGTLSCKFVDCKPVGVVLFNDVDSNKWQGNCDSSGIIIYPKNHFFYSEEVVEEDGEPGGHQDIIVTGDMENVKETQENNDFNNSDNAPQAHLTENT